MSKGSTENEHPRYGGRTMSVSTGSGDHAPHVGPALGPPHRRTSRMDSLVPGMPGANRRMSMYRRGSVAASMRTDNTVLQIPVKLQNTYKLGPEDNEKFSSDKVEKALKSILESFLVDEEYEARKCASMVQNLSDVIKARVKDMHFPRYKIVCNVMIGQNTGQGVRSASRALWETKTDNFACASYQNSSLFAIAMVHGIYFE